MCAKASWTFLKPEDSLDSNSQEPHTGYEKVPQPYRNLTTLATGWGRWLQAFRAVQVDAESTRHVQTWRVQFRWFRVTWNWRAVSRDWLVAKVVSSNCLFWQLRIRWNWPSCCCCRWWWWAGGRRGRGQWHHTSRLTTCTENKKIKASEQCLTPHRWNHLKATHTLMKGYYCLSQVNKSSTSKNPKNCKLPWISIIW